MVKIYFDNCCYNRPFDNQSQLKVYLETQAKLYVQEQIRRGRLSLVWSYIVDYENEQNPFEDRKSAIQPWKDIAIERVEENDNILRFAEKLQCHGVKLFDALHIACALEARCDYYLTTDKKLLHTAISEMKIINPIDFIREWEV